jgi:hypothetical protein
MGNEARVFCSPVCEKEVKGLHKSAEVLDEPSQSRCLKQVEFAYAAFQSAQSRLANLGDL